MLNEPTGTITTLTIVLSSLLLFACATEEENSITIDTTPASIPADAVLLTDSNALTIATELNVLARAINTASKGESGNCQTSGTVTINWIKTTNPSNGTISYSNCNVLNTITHGALGFSVNYTSSINYTLNSYGALSINDNGDDFRLFGIQLTEIGQSVDPNPYPYNRDLTFAVTSNAAIGGGVLFQTISSLDGISNTCAYEGVILVSGANNTKLRISFSSYNAVSIDLSTNGTTYDPVTGSPFLTSTNGPCF
jgi:predicted RecA/RadA family phage recombinase